MEGTGVNNQGIVSSDPNTVELENERSEANVGENSTAVPFQETAETRGPDTSDATAIPSTGTVCQGTGTEIAGNSSTILPTSTVIPSTESTDKNSAEIHPPEQDQIVTNGGDDGNKKKSKKPESRVIGGLEKRRIRDRQRREEWDSLLDKTESLLKNTSEQWPNMVTFFERLEKWESEKTQKAMEQDKKAMERYDKTGESAKSKRVRLTKPSELKPLSSMSESETSGESQGDEEEEEDYMPTNDDLNSSATQIPESVLNQYRGTRPSSHQSRMPHERASQRHASYQNHANSSSYNRPYERHSGGYRGVNVLRNLNQNNNNNNINNNNNSKRDYVSKLSRQIMGGGRRR